MIQFLRMQEMNYNQVLNNLLNKKYKLKVLFCGYFNNTISI